MDVFVSWSGGKDCCLAAYRAIKSGLNIRYLVSVITENTGRLWPHALLPEVLRLQAEAMDVPIIQPWTTVANYEDTFRDTLHTLRQKGIRGGVFGDVSMGNTLAKEHWQWVDSVCQPTGIKPYLPLWGQGREELIRELLESGFEAFIIVVDNDRLGKEWLGRKLDMKMLRELKLRAELSPTGEVGYYHTLVVDGPLFKRRLEILKTDKVMTRVVRDGSCKVPINATWYEKIWYLDIIKCRLDSSGPKG